MRIGFVIPYYITWGGPAGIVVQVGRRLVDRGHEVTVFTTEVGPDKKPVKLPAVDGGMTLRGYANLSPGLARTKRAFFPAKFLRDARRDLTGFDLLHLIEYRHLMAWRVAGIAEALGIPVLMSPHGALPNALQRIAIKNIYDRFFGGPTLARVDHFHALTSTEREIFIAAGIDERRITVIPNGVTLPEPTSPENRAGARKALGIDAESFVILFLARLHPDKALDSLIRVFAAALPKVGDPLLLVAGPDDGALEPCRKLAQELGVADRVRFLGWVEGDKKRDVFAAADLFASLSKYETQPVATLEAMAAGLPCLVSPKASVEGFADGEMGRIVQANEIESATEALAGLFSSRSEAAKVGGVARELIRRRYAWKKIIDDYEKMYERLLSRD